MEIATQVLTCKEMKREVVWIRALLLQMGIEDLDASYGFGCNLPIDQLWKNIKIKTHDLTSFINKNIEEGLYTFGEGDFYIGDPLGVFEFRLDHESAIYLRGENPPLFDKVQTHWIEAGYGCFQRMSKDDKWTHVASSLPGQPQ